MIDDSENHVHAEELCRTCAQAKKDMIFIFSEEGRERILKKLIAACQSRLRICRRLRKFLVELQFTLKEYKLQVNDSSWPDVKENDRLPLQMCLRCILWLETSNQLRDSCLTADFMLRVLLAVDTQEEENEPPPSAVEILNETVDSEETISIETYPEPEDTFVKKSTPDVLEHSTNMEQTVVISVMGSEESENTKSTEKLAAQIQVPPPFKCNECYCNLDSVSKVVSHQQKNHHRNVQWCTECFVFFCSGEAMEDHEKEVHPFGAPPKCLKLWYEPDKQLTLSENQGINNELEQGRRKKKKRRSVKKDHTCHWCKEKFPLEDLTLYKEHLQEHKRARKDELIKKSNIKCDYCEMMFVSQSSKVHHMKLKHRQYKPFICEKCAKTYHTKMSLLDHLTTHTDERPYLCDLCGKSFPNRNFMKNHVTKVHAEKISCSICKIKMDPSRKKLHMRRHYNERVYQCEECGKSFFTITNLKQHLESHSDNVYECEICGNVFSRKNNLHLHKKLHFNVKTQLYVCPATSCANSFSTEEKIVEHCKLHSRDEFPSARSPRRAHNVKPMHCWSCNTPFRSLSTYLSHMNLHHCDKHGNIVSQLILTCNICKNSFNNSVSLIEHLKDHPEAFNLQCRHCKDTFVSDRQRDEHEVTTHGYKKKCEICSKVIDRKKFASHLRTHTGERPFKCTKCEKAFVEKKYLDVHSTIHTGIRNFVCEICSKAFRLKQDLKKHYFTHTNEKMYKCGDCDFSSNRRKDVTRHIAAKHTDNVVDSESD